MKNVILAGTGCAFQVRSMLRLPPPMWFLVLLLCLPAALAADSGDTLAFRQVDSANGLPGDAVYCMAQDRQGYLWLGTFSGLARWDGNSMVTYRPEPGDPESLPSSLVFDIHEDSEGTLWIATDGGGLARYSPINDSFQRYFHQPDEPESLASDRIFSVSDDQAGTIWLGSADAGVLRLNPARGSSRRYGPEDGLAATAVRVMYTDSAGKIWAGTGEGLYRYDRLRDRFTLITGFPGTPAVRAVLEDGDSLLVGTETDGLFRVSPEVAPDSGGQRGSAWQVRRMELGLDSAGLFIRALARDVLGRIWVGTENSGVMVLDADGVVTSLRADSARQDRLGHDAIRAIISDRSGLVWVGTRGSGVFSHNPRAAAIRPWGDTGQQPVLEVRQLLEAADGSVWVASDGDGLWHFDRDGHLLRRYRHDPAQADSLPGDRVICLALAPDGAIWVGTDGYGLARLDPVSGLLLRFAQEAGRPDSLGGMTVWALLFDKSGQLWIGLEGSGLDRMDFFELPGSASAGEGVVLSGAAARFSHFRPQEGCTDSLPGNSVRCMLLDSAGRFWIGLWDGGLVEWDAPAGRVLKRFRPTNEADSLADMSVTALYEDGSRRLWIGTGGSGVERRLEQGGAAGFMHITEADGLVGNDIEGFLEDSAGRVWAVSGRGMSLLDSPSGDIQSWAASDGFQERFTRNALLARRDGSFLVGGPRGLNSFRPEALSHAGAPPVVISNIIAVAGPDPDSRSQAIRRRALRSALSEGRIVLQPRDAALALDFAVLDFVDPDRNRLAVSLRGGPVGTVDLGSPSRAVLGGLAPGEYVLKVTGATAGGVWNREGAELSILVVPPFWRTPAFAAMMVVLALLLMGFIIGLRTRALQARAEELRILSIHMQDAREEERKTAAREVHDELGQLLTAVKMELSWLGRHPPEKTECPDQLKDSLSLVDEAIGSVKAISTRLRPKALDTLSLSEALHWQLEEFHKRSKIDCVANIEPISEEVSQEKATTIFRVFQELLTNVARHAQASQVTVRFAVSDGMMVLAVEDDGRGLPAAAATASSSLGLLGMRERVRHEGGSFGIESPCMPRQNSVQVRQAGQAGQSEKSEPAELARPVGPAGPAGTADPGGGPAVANGSGSSGGSVRAKPGTLVLVSIPLQNRRSGRKKHAQTTDS